MNKTTTFKKRITSSYSATKEKVQNYKADLKKAFYMGYQSGYTDAKNIPTTFGAKNRAISGYRNGITGYNQVKKAGQRLNESEKYSSRW
jgi:ribosome modulation factor